MIDIPATKRGDRVMRFCLYGWGTNAGQRMENDGGVVDALILAHNPDFPWDGAMTLVEQLRLINELQRDFEAIVALRPRPVPRWSAEDLARAREDAKRLAKLFAACPVCDGDGVVETGSMNVEPCARCAPRRAT